jgi:hypothetical protein
LLGIVSESRGLAERQGHTALRLCYCSKYAIVPAFIGKLPVSVVDNTHVLSVLNPIWTTKTETASRVRGRMESILDWAKISGYR